MKKYILAIGMLMTAIPFLDAQDSFPILKGKMDVSIARGTIACDFTLSNIPKIKDYYLRLNSGMNIRYIKNPDGTRPLQFSKSRNDSLSTGEAAAYYLDAYNEQGKYMPAAIQLSYVGMYPVIADTSSAADWKGNIAFNGKSLRMDGSQSAWYPVLYDIQKDRRYDKVLYDIELTCNDCKTLYINGSLPVEGTHARFTSDKPQELTTFLGDFRMAAVNGTYLLNAEMDEKQLAIFEQTVSSYKNYFQSHLDIPYKGNPVYIQTTPVAKGYAWLFASYPTIVNIGFGQYDLKAFGEAQKPYMAHELGHYYFGKYRTFNSELGDMLSEGFAEFLSLQTTRKLASDSLFKVRMNAKLNAMRNFHPVPFAAIKSHDDYQNRELYVYYYAPMIFTAIEKEIGEEAMWKWVQSLLSTPAEFTNYRFMQQTLDAVLKNNNQSAAIQAKYFTTDRAVQNAAITLELHNDMETAGTPPSKPIPQTYFYYVIAEPVIDAGSPENRTVLHSEIRQVTCLPEELSQTSGPLFKQVKAGCENAGGCSSNFNTYNSFETAGAGLQRKLKPYQDNPKYIIRILK